MTKHPQGKLLFFLHTHALGGVEKQSFSLLKGIASHFSLIVLYHEPWVKEYLPKNIEDYPVAMGKKIGGQKSFLLFIITAWWYSLTYLPKLWKFRSSHFNTSVVILHTLNEKFLVTPLAKLFGYKVIWIEHGPVSSWISGLPLLLHRLFSSLTTKIIAVSESTRQSLLLEGIKKDKLLAILNGIAPREIPKKLGNQEKKEGFLLVCMGRIVQMKGQRVLLEAVQQLQPIIPGLMLKIVGDGEDLESLKKYAKDLKIDTLVTFTGWVTDVYDVVQEATLVINPTLYDEGFGLTIVEAMMAGVPAVASRCNAHTEIIQDGITGMLFTPGDSKELAKVISHLWQNPQVREKIAHEGYQHAQKCYSEKGMISQYSSVFLSLISKEK